MADGLFDFDEAANVIKARRLWHEAGDPDDDAERLLRGWRGIPPWPTALRFSPECYHSPLGRSFPALIAAVTDDSGRVFGIARHYLDDEARPRNLMLGEIGGHAVRLGAHRRGGDLFVVEGLVLAIRLHFARGGGNVIWCPLTASGIARVTLPPEANVLVVPTSAAGRAAAEKRGLLTFADGLDRLANMVMGRRRRAGER
ncbi:MAG TPA: hypothetical protein VND87_16995 [Stellaceae bacterium]|nr:hypothetical protein [Stellaceae bacterium]